MKAKPYPDAARLLTLLGFWVSSCIITPFSSGAQAPSSPSKPVAHLLAPAPPMGWNSWNWFGKKGVNEQVVREVIDAMVKEGLRDAGYTYVVVDGGWRDTALGPNGELRAHPERFPHGIKALADYAHARGLKFGLHTAAGTADCGGDPVGGYGHEAVQIRQFASWGVDLVKLDKCRFASGWTEATLHEVYDRWHRLLGTCGRDIVLSISAYTFRDWNPALGEMSRTTGDIRARVNGGAAFDGVRAHGPLSVMAIADINNRSADKAGHGYWNDPDMLVVGAQGLSAEEQQAHFALWCIMSAPLFLGNDPRHMTDTEKAIILNEDCIAIDQDSTEQGRRIAAADSTAIWAKHLAGGRAAILLLNRGTTPQELTLDLPGIGLKGEVRLKEVFSRRQLGSFSGKLHRQLPPHSGLLLLSE